MLALKTIFPRVLVHLQVADEFLKELPFCDFVIKDGKQQ